MSCEETQKSFSPYVDGQLTTAARSFVDAHLAGCPVCRHQLARTRHISRALANLERPAPPAHLTATINDLLLIERAARRQQPTGTFPARFLRWLEPRLMPYTVGALASALLFIAVSTALRPQFRLLRELTVAAREVSDDALDKSLFEDESGYDVTKPVPTINPNGALAALIRTPSTSGDDSDADDMVIYADVFSNGSASLAGVVQAPRNLHMLDEVQEAFRQTPAFLPASHDRRPETMRVVLSLSKINVHERSF